MAWSELSTLLWRCNTGIAGSEPPQSIAGWMDICIRLVGFFWRGGWSSVGRGFAMGRCSFLFVPMCTKLIQKSSEWRCLCFRWSSVKDVVRDLVCRYATIRRTGTFLTLTHQMNVINSEFVKRSL
jgi:hypothetical protein